MSKNRFLRDVLAGVISNPFKKEPEPFEFKILSGPNGLVPGVLTSCALEIVDTKDRVLCRFQIPLCHYSPSGRTEHYGPLQTRIQKSGTGLSARIVEQGGRVLIEGIDLGPMGLGFPDAQPGMLSGETVTLTSFTFSAGPGIPLDRFTHRRGKP